MQFQPHFCIYKEFLYVVSSLLVLPTCIVSECLHLKNAPVKYSQTNFWISGARADASISCRTELFSAGFEMIIVEVMATMTMMATIKGGP